MKVCKKIEIMALVVIIVAFLGGTACVDLRAQLTTHCEGGGDLKNVKKLRSR